MQNTIQNTAQSAQATMRGTQNTKSTNEPRDQKTTKVLIKRIQAPGYSAADIKITIAESERWDGEHRIDVEANNDEMGFTRAYLYADLLSYEKVYAKVQNGMIYIFGDVKDKVDRFSGVVPILS